MRCAAGARTTRPADRIPINQIDLRNRARACAAAAEPAAGDRDRDRERERDRDGRAAQRHARTHKTLTQRSSIRARAKKQCETGAHARADRRAIDEPAAAAVAAAAAAAVR